MIKPKRTKRGTRNQTIAVSSPNKIIEGMKAKAVDNGADPFEKNRGKPSYALKAQQNKDERKIAAVIKNFRDSNRDSTYLEVYEVLHNRFPWIFEKETKDIASSNVSHMINGYDLWRRAYHINSDENIALAELVISERLDSDTIETKDAISAFNALTKYKLAKQQLEQNIQSDNENDAILFGFAGDIND